MHRLLYWQAEGRSGPCDHGDFQVPFTCFGAGKSETVVFKMIKTGVPPQGIT